MTVRALGFLAVGILLIPITLSSQALPPRDKTPDQAATGTARLRGRVVAADSGSPLRRAQVTATASAPRTMRLTSTDAEGRYEFVDLPPGRYTISVSKAGYVTLAFGQRRPFDGGRPLDLIDGQSAEQIDFALPRGSVITGRITDQSGEPIIAAQMQVMRFQYRPGGRRQLVMAGSGLSFLNITNDRGEFRLFGLMPGTYLVSALAGGSGVVSLTQAGPNTGGVEAMHAPDGFAPTYYPGTASLSEAQPVVVNLSEEAQASFSLVASRMARITGVVRRADGRPAIDSDIALRPGDTQGAGMGARGYSSVAADGSFSFANVPPAQYLLEVGPSRPAPSGGAQPTPSREFASVPLTVSGSDVSGLTIVTRPGATASGGVIFQSRAPRIPQAGSLRIMALAADPSRTGGELITSAVDSNGRFLLRDLTGHVLFRAMEAPPNFVLKSVTLNGVDMTDRPYDAGGGDVNVEIVFAEPAQLTGTARNARGELMRDFKVALFPAGAKPSFLTMRFMGGVTADPNGRFQFSRLAAGEYLGVAVESFEQGEEWDPAFQQRVIPSAKRFVVGEGQALTIELPFVE